MSTATTTPRPRRAKATTTTTGTTTTTTRTRRPKPAPAPEPLPEFQLQERGRTYRKITFALGPVTFLGGVHGAIADQTDPLVTLCKRDHPAIRIQRPDRCPACGNSDKDTFVKGQIIGDEITVLDKEEYEAIKKADESYTKSMVLRMVIADDQLIIPAGSLYYLSAQGAAGAAYALIAAVVKKRPDVAFLGELSFGGAPKLFRLEVTSQGVLALREIARPETLREQPSVEADADETSLGFLEQLVDASVTPFDPTGFANPHAAKVSELLKATAPTAAATPTAAVSGDDILAKLQASIAAITPPPATKTTRRRKAA